VTDAARVVSVSASNPPRALRAVRVEFADADVVQVPINVFQVFFVRLAYRGPLVAGVGPGIQPQWPYRQFGRLLGIDKKIKVHEQDRRWERSGYDTAVCTATIDTDRFFPYDGDRRASIRDELNIPMDATVYLYVGELRESKGAELVDELSALTRENELVVVVGDGPLRSRFEGRSDLRYEGFVDNDRMPDYINAADIVLGPRRADNTSNIGLESIACGTPYITTAEGYIRDLFEDRDAYVWAERTPEDVLATARGLVEDAEAYQAQVERGRSTIAEMPLTLDQALELHLQVYEELAASR
jgi:glycosyltransferase involved in cell wall biosynthesis